MSIQLLSTNIGKLQSIPWAKQKTKTGIFKTPVDGPVMVQALGLENDRIGNKKYHGGPDQAIYIYSAQDYAWWEESLDRKLPFGLFGENLTVSNLGEQPPRIGDRWQIGEVLLELSAPRVPCSTLAARMEEPTFVKLFAQANRSGVYARVLQAGSITAGMEVTVNATPLPHPTIEELFRVWHQGKKDPELLDRALESPLASRFREEVERWVARSKARET